MRTAELGFGPPTAPTARRGFLNLVASLALGGASAIYGAVQANQLRQRNKGYINQSFDLAQQQLGYRQAGVAEDEQESLASRGLVGGSGANAIYNAAGVAPLGQGQGPRDIGSQSTANMRTQFGLEQTDLTNQRSRALSENNAQATNSEIGAIAGGLGVAANVATGLGDLGALKQTAPPPSSQPAATPAPSAQLSGDGGGADAVRSAMLSGISFGGIHPVNPLGDKSSSWYGGGAGGGTRVAGGEANAEFNG